MLIEWTVRVQCEGCGAVITYESEKPEWKDDDSLRVLYEDARAFVRDNQGRIFDIFHSTPPFVLKNWPFSGCRLAAPPEMRYVDCPSCGGRAYLGSAGEE